MLSAVSVHTLTFTPQKQLPPPLYTPNLTTVTLCFSKYQLNRLQRIQNALAQTVVQAPKFKYITPSLSPFQPVTTGDIPRLISRATCKHCDLDPAPTWLVKRAIIAAVCNASLQSGYFHQSQKLARVTARLKRPSMDPDDLNSFRPISNLTFLSKIMERVVIKQFSSYAALAFC